MPRAKRNINGAGKVAAPEEPRWCLRSRTAGNLIAEDSGDSTTTKNKPATKKVLGKLQTVTEEVGRTVTSRVPASSKLATVRTSRKRARPETKNEGETGRDSGDETGSDAVKCVVRRGPKRAGTKDDIPSKEDKNGPDAVTSKTEPTSSHALVISDKKLMSTCDGTLLVSKDENCEPASGEKADCSDPPGGTIAVKVSRKRGRPQTKNGGAVAVDDRENVETKVVRRGRKPASTVDVSETMSKKDSNGKDNKVDEVSAKVQTDLAIKKVESKATSKPADEGKALVSIKFTGSVPVDEHFANTSGLTVYHDAATNVDWDCMLNQSNVNRNNNKFYLIQLLTNDRCSVARVYRRWGRIGERGRSDSEEFANIEDAKDNFSKLFKQKTGNVWIKCITGLEEFNSITGKYDLIKRDFSLQGPNTDNGNKEEISKEIEDAKEIPDSTLSTEVQELINLICNVKLMVGQLKELKYDPSKAPLGKLSSEQIKLGYEALKRIEMCLDLKSTPSELYEACNVYYTRIPHVFSRSGIQVIDSPSRLRDELALLSSLDEAREAIRLFSQECDTINPTDRHYTQLNCVINSLGKDSDDYKIISKSVLSTHAKDNHKFGISILDIFELDKGCELDVFEDVGNRQLLWHGSRMMNYAGIIGRGLRIAPPEAPCTGYMFGKGVYFADVSSKSVQYCYASKTNPVGFLLIAEVSLGDCHRLCSCEYRLPKVLPPGKRSTHGVGRIRPKSFVDLKGLPLPMGPVVEQDRALLPPNGRTNLCFNEYIVYSTNQIRLRYLIKLSIT